MLWIVLRPGRLGPVADVELIPILSFPVTSHLVLDPAEINPPVHHYGQTMITPVTVIRLKRTKAKQVEDVATPAADTPTCHPWHAMCCLLRYVRFWLGPGRHLWRCPGPRSPRSSARSLMVGELWAIQAI